MGGSIMRHFNETLLDNSDHSKIEHINGKWIKGFVKGKLVKEG